MNRYSLQALLSTISKRYRHFADALIELEQGGDGRSLIDVLLHYQNLDGGFAHGLEADIQMPYSNVASTNMAVNLLQHVTHPDKEYVMQDIIGFYDEVFDKETLSFPMVPKEVDDFPHAIWWNYDSLDSFTYGNPNPEVCGTLFAYQHLLSRIDYEAFVQKVMTYIETDMKDTVSMHSLMSCLMMYRRMDGVYQQRLKPYLKEYVDHLVEDDPSKWEEYTLEPYKVFLIAPEFLDGHEEALRQSIEVLEQQLQQGPIVPNWNWYQYQDEFEIVKDQWIVLLTFDAVRAIKQYRKQ